MVSVSFIACIAVLECILPDGCIPVKEGEEIFMKMCFEGLTYPLMGVRGRIMAEDGSAHEAAAPYHDGDGIETVSAGLHFKKDGPFHRSADPHHKDIVSLMYDCSRHGHTSSIVASFLLFPEKEGTKQGRKAAARSPLPESLNGRYLRRARSLRSLRQALRLNATGQTFSLRAPGSIQTGGEAAPMSICVVHFSNAHPF